MKKIRGIALFLALILTTASFSGCGNTEKQEGTFRFTMVTDVGGVNDGSFNQSAWTGFQRLMADYPQVQANYTESKQASDFTTNIDRSVDGNYDMIWAIGFDTLSAMEREARLNPNQKFAIVDTDFSEPLENALAVTFKAQDSAFLVGYIAALTTKTNNVGFIGAFKTAIIDQFEYGFRAGVDYGSKQIGKQINIQSQITQSFSDEAKGKQIAMKMYADGCDIIFHAAGKAGDGLFQAAKERNQWAIGVDSDQAYLAPDNVLTSALKRVDNAIYEISEKYMNGEDIFGKHYEMGLAENAVGIPENNPNLDAGVYQKTMQVQELIKEGKIVPPYNQGTYETYKQNIPS